MSVITVLLCGISADVGQLLVSAACTCCKALWPACLVGGYRVGWQQDHYAGQLQPFYLCVMFCCKRA